VKEARQDPAQVAKSIEMAIVKEERRERHAIAVGAVVAMKIKGEFVRKNPDVIEILNQRGFEVGKIPPGIDADECEQDVQFVWRKGASIPADAKIKRKSRRRSA